MVEPNPLDLMLGDLRGQIIELMAKHQYWEVRIHGSDGIARLETICQEPRKYPLRVKGAAENSQRK